MKTRVPARSQGVRSSRRVGPQLGLSSHRTSTASPPFRASAARTASAPAPPIRSSATTCPYGRRGPNSSHGRHDVRRSAVRNRPSSPRPALTIRVDGTATRCDASGFRPERTPVSEHASAGRATTASGSARSTARGRIRIRGALHAAVGTPISTSSAAGDRLRRSAASPSPRGRNPDPASVRRIAHRVRVRRADGDGGHVHQHEQPDAGRVPEGDGQDQVNSMASPASACADSAGSSALRRRARDGCRPLRRRRGGRAGTAPARPGAARSRAPSAGAR